jgi:tetratricopeptide (TPR) repeat protein
MAVAEGAPGSNDGAQMIRSGLADHLNDPEIYYRSGIAHGRSAEYELAVLDLQRAIKLRPDHALAHVALARAYLALGNGDAALFHAHRAAELAPQNQELAATLAEFLEANRDTQEAWQIVSRLLEQGSQSQRLAIAYANLAPSLGRQEDALALIERVLAGGQVTLPTELASLHFAAAKLLDSLGRYDAAFERASVANSLRSVTYHPAQVERAVNQWIRYFTRPTLRRLPRATHGSELPVFIVGVPRSGTTLIEQILSSHPAGGVASSHPHRRVCRLHRRHHH